MSLDANLQRLAKEDPERYRIEVRRVHPEWFEPLDREVRFEMTDMDEDGKRVEFRLEVFGEGAGLTIRCDRSQHDEDDWYMNSYQINGSFGEITWITVKLVYPRPQSLQTAVNAFLESVQWPPMSATLSPDWLFVTLTDPEWKEVP